MENSIAISHLEVRCVFQSCQDSRCQWDITLHHQLSNEEICDNRYECFSMCYLFVFLATWLSWKGCWKWLKYKQETPFRNKAQARKQKVRALKTFSLGQHYAFSEKGPSRANSQITMKMIRKNPQNKENNQKYGQPIGPPLHYHFSHLKSKNGQKPAHTDYTTGICITHCTCIYCT